MIYFFLLIISYQNQIHFQAIHLVPYHGSGLVAMTWQITLIGFGPEEVQLVHMKIGIIPILTMVSKIQNCLSSHIQRNYIISRNVVFY